MADRPLPPVDEVDDEFIKKALNCGPAAANTEWAANVRRALYEAKAGKSYPPDELAARRKARHEAPASVRALAWYNSLFPPLDFDPATLARWQRYVEEMAAESLQRAKTPPPDSLPRLPPIVLPGQYFPPGVNPVPPPTAQGKLDALAKLQRKSRDGIRNGQTHSLTEASRLSVDDFSRWQRGELPPKPGDRG